MLAVTESQRPVLPLEGGDGDDSGEGPAGPAQWATAKPARYRDRDQGGQ